MARGKFIDITLRLKDKFSGEVKKVGATLQAQARQIQRTGKQIERTGKSIASTGKSLTKGVTVPVVGLGVAATKVAAEFEKGMSTVESIVEEVSESDLAQLTKRAKETGLAFKETGNTTDTAMNILAAKAMEMGEKTKYSLTESTEAFKYMAQAGWKATDMMNGIEGIMYLAGATGEDLASTSDIVTDALTAFGMAASETNDFVDTLARTASSTNTDVGKMGETFQYVAPVAGALGYKAKDVAVAIGAMASAGVKSSKAGTALRSWLTNMAKPSKATAEVMDKLKLSLTDKDGKMKSMATMLTETRKKLGGLSEAERTSAAASLAGKTGMSGLLSIVKMSDKEFANITERINDSAGAAEKMYKVANDNLSGQMTELKSKVEVLGVAFGNKMLPTIKKATEFVKALTDKVNSLTDKQQETIIKVAAVAAAVGPAVLVIGKLTTGIGRTVKAVGNLGSAMKKAGSLTKAVFTPGGKIALILTAIAVVTLLVVKNWDKIAPVAKKAFGTAKKVLADLGITSESTKAVVSKIGDVFGKVKDAVIKAWNAAQPTIQKAIPIVKKIGAAVGKNIIGAIKRAISIVGLIAKRFASMASAAKKAFSGAAKNTEPLTKKLAPIRKGFNLIVGSIKDVWKVAKPALSKLAAGASDLWKKISPVLEKIGELGRSVFAVMFGGAIGAAVGYFKSFVATAADMLGGVMKVFSGIIDFISGVFTGNWKKAWTGVKKVFVGIFESLAALAKAPINAVIGIINGAIGGINKIGVKIPKWVPKIGGKKFGINVPKIPTLAVGTKDWHGGVAQISERGGEIVDLPKGSRVYPHDDTVQKSYTDGAVAAIRVLMGSKAQAQGASSKIVSIAQASADAQKESYIGKLVAAFKPLIQPIIQSAQAAQAQGTSSKIVSIAQAGAEAQKESYVGKLVAAFKPLIQPIIQSAQATQAQGASSKIVSIAQASAEAQKESYIGKLVAAFKPLIQPIIQSAQATQTQGASSKIVSIAQASTTSETSTIVKERSSERSDEEIAVLKAILKEIREQKPQGQRGDVKITVAKLADEIVVREEADIDKLAREMADKLEKKALNIGGGDIGYLYQVG